MVIKLLIIYLILKINKYIERVRCGVVYCMLRYGAVMLFYGRFWCGFCSLCGLCCLVNSPSGDIVDAFWLSREIEGPAHFL